jgi:hypothetical protein
MRHRKNRTMKGGFWNNITDMFKKKPTATTPSPSHSSSSPSSSSPSSSPTPTSPSPASPSPASSPNSLTGGRGRRTRRIRRIRRHRTMRGGYSASHSLNNLAATASPFSGNKTAQPQVWLGGKSRKHRHHKRCKH